MRQLARFLLLELLPGGYPLSRDVLDEAEARGIPEWAVYRARKDLGVEFVQGGREGFGVGRGVSELTLPLEIQTEADVAVWREAVARCGPGPMPDVAGGGQAPRMRVSTADFLAHARAIGRKRRLGAPDW